MTKHSCIPVIDLFAGPGGLGEGFSRSVGPDGSPAFKIRLSIEKDEHAHRTLQLRSFFRQFPHGKAPDDYYECLQGELTVNELFAKHPQAASAAQKEAWLAELGSEHTPASEVKARITTALDGKKEWVLIGGPPCQAYSLAGRSRNRGIKNYTLEGDPKHNLYTEYLRIIADHWPTVFVMENVPGLLSARVSNQGMFERILGDLEAPRSALQFGAGERSHRYSLYSLVRGRTTVQLRPSDFVVKAELYGVPQARRRVIIVGVRDDVGDMAPPLLQPHGKLVTVAQVLDGLPRVRAGLSREPDGDDLWRDALKTRTGVRWLDSSARAGGIAVQALIASTLDGLAVPKCGRGTEFLNHEAAAAHAPDWFLDNRLGGVCNHVTRVHIIKDLYRYLYAACFAKVNKRSPKLCDFPRDLLPAHANVEKAMGHGYFAERFRVQLCGEPATTITSHLSRDGHHFIHPDPTQCRSLTVREAARLQTFPDNYFFVGTRTQQYIQVGNAVPPFLARQIAEAVLDVLVRTGMVG
jgi:DNA (cytosine-5)-methyltransferase 1